MINYSGVSQSLTANQVLYSNEAVVKAIAQTAMVSMAEADVEMLCDCPQEYPTKADLERVFQGIHDQATDLITDMFDELKAKVLAELAEKRYSARVTGLHYDDDGALNDITVSIKFD